MGLIKRREMQQYHSAMSRLQQAENAIDLALSDPNLTSEARTQLEEQKSTIDTLQARGVGAMRGRQLAVFNRRLNAQTRLANDVVEMLADASPGLALHAVEAPLSMSAPAARVAGHINNRPIIAHDTLNPTSLLETAANHAGGETQWQSGAELNRLALSDPAAFQDYWNGLDDAGRQAAQLQMQQASSMQMQLTTMTSTLLKNEHESAMAVIRNLAV